MSALIEPLIAVLHHYSLAVFVVKETAVNYPTIFGFLLTFLPRLVALASVLIVLLLKLSPSKCGTR
jgi:hypothetical protein